MTGLWDGAHRGRGTAEEGPPAGGACKKKMRVCSGALDGYLNYQTTELPRILFKALRSMQLQRQRKNVSAIIFEDPGRGNRIRKERPSSTIVTPGPV